MLSVGLEYDEMGVLVDAEENDWFWPDNDIRIAEYLLVVEEMKHFQEDMCR